MRLKMDFDDRFDADRIEDVMVGIYIKEANVPKLERLIKKVCEELRKKKRIEKIIENG